MQRIVLIAIAILFTGAVFSTASAQRGVNADYQLERIETSRVASGVEQIEIKLGRNAGRFKAVAVRILDRPLKIRDVEIIFGNGQYQRVYVRKWFDEGLVIEPIKLKGKNSRFIRKIIVRLRPIPQKRRARIEFLAERAEPPVVLLGTRSIRQGERRITLPLRDNDRRLESIALRVDGQPVLVRKIEVTFANGEISAYRIGRRLQNGQFTPPLSFEAKSRYVDNVDVVIKPLRRSRPARLTVVGRIDDAAPRRRRRASKPKVVKKKAVKREWVLLGSQSAKRFKSDVDVFPVGRAKGRFKAIRISAKKHDIRMFEMRVQYGNGSIETVAVNGVLRDGHTSQQFDLKGRERYIKSIQFRYQTTFNFKGRAIVELWGLQTN
ncbi:MAG: hypothetical protein ACRBCJ_06855 [Hyphomicrobiaceae bacterium]